MKKSAKSKASTMKTPDFSLLQWLGVIGLSIFIFFFPYQTALFNSLIYNAELPLYEAMLFVFALLLLVAFYLFRVWKIDSIRSILSIAILLLPAIYYISSFHAVAAHNAKLMTLIYCLLAGFFIFGMYLAATFRARKVLEYALMLSGYFVVFYGLLNLFGQRYFPDALWFTSGNYRLTSVFQYSNTYAGYLVALLLIALYSAIHSSRIYTFALHAFMLVPIWISLMLTYSRGALVLLPILILLVLPFMRLYKQMQYIAALIITVVSSFVILEKVSDNSIQIAQIVLPQFDGDTAKPISIVSPLALEGWLVLLAASFVTVIMMYIIHFRSAWLENKLTALAGKKWSVVAVPAAVTVLGIFSVVLLISGVFNSLLPQSIADRLENINFNQHSVLERQTFYVDAMKVVKDYPLLGAGGGGWSALFEQYQNNPYVSRQAHSYFIQSLVEVGWVGFLILISLILFIYYRYCRNYFADQERQGSHVIFFIFSIAMLTHSLIDFDMSFVYLGSLVFLSLGVLIAVYHEQMLIPRWETIKDHASRYVFPSVIALLSIILFVVSFREYEAQKSFDHSLYLAIQEKKPMNEIMPALDKAIRLSPNHPSYNLLKADWYAQAYRQTGDKNYLNEAAVILDNLKQNEPYERQLLLAEYRNFKNLEEHKKAIASLEEGISKFQWDINFYETAIMEYAANGQTLKDTDPTQAARYWDRGLELLDRINKRKKQLEELPEEQLQGRDFDVTPFMRQALGQIYFNKQMYQEAIAMLEPLKEMDFQDAYIRNGIRYYLAALHAVGKSNENISNLLFQANEQEKSELDRLILESEKMK
ncbi:O-antigen ligase family protein [Paenibacillus abyssi]|uniref:O-antigen polymerase n=1 Tax=Paenibacillus abyssi TaxID=1340531 RepID=A0A917CNQ0_9BACL|nr:O-antigen ligase family protein [Paenibacillus abyssi]GGF92380.1 O-antigen polymerase [Paenibacillus abyssi]